MLKYQSKNYYAIGTVLYDNETGEVFEVVGCDLLDLGLFGITVKEIKSLK